MSKGRQLAVEVLGRIGAIVAAVYLLPSVFATDVGHFRTEGACVWRPTGATLKGCLHRHLLADASREGLINLPYRHLAFEFPPLPFLTLPLAGKFWGPLAVSQLLFGGAMAACEFGALVYLRRAFPEEAAAITRWWTVVVLPAALIAWFRFDFLPVLFATVALVAILKRRGCGGAIAAGWLSKLWPVVMLAALVVERRWRQLAKACLVLALVTAAWFAWSPSGFRTFLSFRAGKGLEIESVLGSLRLAAAGGTPRIVSGAWVVAPDGYAWFNSAMVVALVAFACACVWRAWRPGADLTALCGALAVASMIFSRIISAQYVVWLAPFVVLLAARGRRRVGYLALGATSSTFVYLLVFDRLIAKGNRLAASLMVVRNAFLVAVLVELFVLIRPRGGPIGNISSIEGVAGSLG